MRCEQRSVNLPVVTKFREFAMPSSFSIPFIRSLEAKLSPQTVVTFKRQFPIKGFLLQISCSMVLSRSPLPSFTSI